MPKKRYEKKGKIQTRWRLDIEMWIRGEEDYTYSKNIHFNTLNFIKARKKGVYSLKAIYRRQSESLNGKRKKLCVSATVGQVYPPKKQRNGSPDFFYLNPVFGNRGLLFETRPSKIWLSSKWHN
ncbi:MAG: hypothetical protein A2271_02090 [Candidatus Moranbacteria bacterium RIFOXYA12_FULL_35_19]|nr:MAG: hypothetical protein UR78_C0022G0010 [Candidatus Moranbacteria bacterium GW2011_GWF2_35_39]OGI31796.1 MAG: hypothetical protein A2343_03475 [Candidatus Moranbacteria bacterium RIFOXYB12_FULL_35_8]OGI32093.1 MAG: hypothetical protein A2489_01650 [Candidatus Moranbacteria bacterium RIFOXYC12_FULL_36_13]OGI36753.1 MAG: hypothetical protein A2271_02090 [Candidatus Moranbacteria bacterium RIFOXYA12_FULL_35_19]